MNDKLFCPILKPKRKMESKKLEERLLNDEGKDIGLLRSICFYLQE